MAVVHPLPPRIAYLVHDLADAAVMRRVRMLHAGGAQVTVVGFQRHAMTAPDIDGAPTIALGVTRDGRLVHRAAAVLRTFASGRIHDAVQGCDVVVARNLEMLVLAARSAGSRRLVYECLDIHRTLLENGLASRAIQWIERVLLGRIDLLMTSSPRFATDYFAAKRRLAAPVILVENKLLVLAGEPVPQSRALPAGPPWVIGWFGMLRCKRTLAHLSEIVRAADGRIEVVIAGIPSENEFDDFAGTVAAVPGMTFVGRYSSDQLSALYGRVHYSWAIDYFEQGLNSTWLLPNRLYEALAHGVVPIALGEVETGRWLVRHGVGLVVNDAAEVGIALNAMLPDTYVRAQQAIAALPTSVFTADAADCRQLVEAIVGTGSGGTPAAVDGA